MQVARRVYLYLISFISLMMVLAGAANLLRLVLELAMGAGPPQNIWSFGGADYRREQFSLWGAMLLVGGIVWAIHWLLAQRGVAATNPAAAEERQSVLRKLFLYAVLATALWSVARAGAGLLHDLLRALPWPEADVDLPFLVSGTVAPIVVYSLGGAYYWWVRRQDLAATPEIGRAATVRRWYFYVVNYVSLSVVLFQTVSLARFVWQTITGGAPAWQFDEQWVPGQVAGSLNWIVVAGVVWLLHWWAVQRQTATDEAEQRSALRKVYLYGMTAQTVGFTLANLSFLLYDLFRVVWGTDPLAGTDESLLTAAGSPVLFALVYGAFWAYHWQVLKGDTRFAGAGVAFNAAIRRFYYYLVSVAGLGMLAGGVMSLLRLLIDGLLGGAFTTELSRQGWGDQIGFVTTLIIVGTPVWLAGWLPMQREALAADGAGARQSLPRRLYLFLVLLASMLALLGSTAVLIYQVLRNLGTPALAWVSDMSWALATTVTAGVLLAYHLVTLVGDLRARAPAPAGPAVAIGPDEAAGLLLLRAPTVAQLDMVIARLQSELPEDTRADIIPAPGVTPGEVRAWLAARNAPTAPPLSPPQPGPPVPRPLSI
jgi:hypothetical protein